jgi:hypothetical protein
MRAKRRLRTYTPAARYGALLAVLAGLLLLGSEGRDVAVRLLLGAIAYLGAEVAVKIFAK